MSDTRLKVLVLADSRAFHTERYVQELRRQDCVVLPASLERGSLRHFHLRGHGPTSLQYPLATPQVKALIRRFKPDIINAHFASGYGYLAALASTSDTPPIVCHLWGSDILLVPHKSPLHWYKTHLALEMASLVLADSVYLIGRARKVGPIRRAAVIPWGIEQTALDKYVKDKAQSRPLNVVMPRPHERVYNNLFVLRALAPMIRSGQVRLTVPDWGTEVETFKRGAAATGSTAVTYYGRKSRDEYLSMVAAHDVYLSASRSDSSPASLIEAMALGLIPVVGNIPGVLEWAHPDGAELFDLDDEPSLAAAMQRVLDNTRDYQAIRELNHAAVRERGVFENNIARTISLMNNLAGRVTE